MPRRKQGHTTTTEQQRRETSGSEVKKKSSSGVSSNDTIDNTTNYAGLLYTIKAVSTPASGTVNGNLHVATSSQNFALRPLEISAIQFITSNGNKLETKFTKAPQEKDAKQSMGIRCRPFGTDTTALLNNNNNNEDCEIDKEMSQTCDKDLKKEQTVDKTLPGSFSFTLNEIPPPDNQLFHPISTCFPEFTQVQNENDSAGATKEPLRLPSSVYGTTTSNIETVLTGLNFKGSKLSNVTANQESAPKLIGNDTLESLTTSSPLTINNSKLIIHTSFPKQENVLKNISKTTAKEKLSPKATGPSKLVIPLTFDSNSSDDSSSHISDSQKPSKFPKITSPQILEQHITKIISQNAAIVETLDPLWSKRYLRQTSQNSDEAKKLNNGNKSKNDKISPILATDGVQSKLQSALLGTLDVEHQKQTVLCKTDKQSNNKNESNGGASTKNFLCMKQEQVNYGSDTLNLHPQNPEGSIIKDLLLKTKLQTKSSESLVYSVSSGVINKREEVLLCQKCGTIYYDKKLFDIHCKCCDDVKNSKSTHESIINSSTFSSSIEQLFRNDCTNSKSPTEQVGQILKTQLLSPLTNYKSLVFKKRKISEPIMPLGESKDDFPMSYISQSEDFHLSPQRSRSQSVHLFGGEVQIRDGANLKRLKIGSNAESSSEIKRKYSVIDFQPSKVESKLTLPDQNNKNLPSPPCTVEVSSFPFVPSEDFKNNASAKRPEYVSVLHKAKKYLYTSADKESVTHLPVIKENRCDPINSSESDQNDALSDSGFLCTTEKTPVPNSEKHAEGSQEANLLPPTITLTPSSPNPALNDKDLALADEKEKFLSLTRPNSLPLKKKPFTMVGSTLVSPDTPRPKKSCMQLYINGQAYTYLGLKCSTRSTYCCIYRPQPMYVLQDTDPKLSMYSNWQVVPAKEELGGMTPGQMLAFYNSKQSVSRPGNVSTTAKLGELLSFTHSSYWTFRSKIEEEEAKEKSQEPWNVESPDDTTNLPMDCSQLLAVRLRRNQAVV